MAWTTTHDLAEFQSQAGAFLRRDPARHTVLLTVAAMLESAGVRQHGEGMPRFGWWRTDDGVGGAFLQTPPRPVLLSRMPDEAVEPLVRALADTGGPPVTGANAERPVAEAFAAWSGLLTGAVVTSEEAYRLYRLSGLTPQDPPPRGRARTATADDRDLLLRWFEDFAEEVGEPTADLERSVDERVGHGRVTLWEVEGQPVSLAAVTRVVAGMARVAPVYTPPRLRARGYAGAATAEVSRKALEAGAEEVLLFTEVTNPTSNALYQRLGYRPLGEHVVLTLDH